MDPSLRTLIEQAEFKESFRGYDRAQVDDTLEQLASRAGKLESEVAEAARRLEDAETRIRAEADAEVEARVKAKAGAGGAAPVRNEEADAEEVRLTLVMAQRTADAAVAEARVQAEKLLDEARTEALRTTADARSESARERQDGRKRLAVEIKDLEDVRTVLQGDIHAMELHVKSEREQLTNAIDRLRELLKDPAAFRTAAPPVPTPVVIPESREEPAAAAEPAAPEPVPGKAPSDGSSAKTAAPAAPAAPGGKNATSTTGSAPAEVGQASGAKAPVGQIAPGVADAGAAANGNKAAAGASDTPAVNLSADAAHEEDAFLSELRKAMTDDEQPSGAHLNPGSSRTPDQSKTQSSAPSASDTDKSRFGRRR